ncbi:MAG TPA: hypothetical protein VNX46_10215 [Candidatus Acidoferrum sp.]|jgi:hypothetical protein|nr:hypothetical protein [Candidatus Acidoferrum sp.]
MNKRLKMILAALIMIGVTGGLIFAYLQMFYAHPPIQLRVYSKALGAFPLLQGEKAGMRAG